MFTFEHTKVDDLKQGEWNVVKGCGEIEMSHYVVKPEGAKVTIGYVYGTTEDDKEFQFDGTVININEEVFMYSEELAKYSLQTMSFKELIYNVIECQSLVFELVYNTATLVDKYPNHTKLKELVHVSNISDSEVSGVVIEGRPICKNFPVTAGKVYPLS